MKCATLTTSLSTDLVLVKSTKLYIKVKGKQGPVTGTIALPKSFNQNQNGQKSTNGHHTKRTYGNNGVGWLVCGLTSFWD